MDKQLSFILFTAETAPSFAGDGLNALLFAKTLVKKGHAADIVCLNPDGLLSNKEEFDGVVVNRISYRYKTKAGRFLLRLRMVFTLLNKKYRNSYWLIYGSMPTHKLIIIFGWLRGVKVVFRSTLYGFDNVNSCVLSGFWLSQVFNRNVYRKVSAYYALNSAFEKEWMSMYSTPIFVSPQGVNLIKYSSIGYNKSDLRKRLDLPESKIIVLIVGHLINRKGFPELFEWLSKINDDFLLVHLGRSNAPVWDAVSVKNAEMNKIRIEGESLLADRVLFVGECSTPEFYYLASDIFILSSYYEGFPSNSVNESMAAGLALLIRKIVGSDDYVEEDVNGSFFESESEFIEKFRRMLNDIDLRNRLGDSARKFAVENNNIDDVVDRFLAFVNEKMT
ncbi:MAG: glycosyltransferase family 4 protein [Bacteroidales bacterium]